MALSGGVNSHTTRPSSSGATERPANGFTEDAIGRTESPSVVMVDAKTASLTRDGPESLGFSWRAVNQRNVLPRPDAICGLSGVSPRAVAITIGADQDPLKCATVIPAAIYATVQPFAVRARET